MTEEITRVNETEDPKEMQHTEDPGNKDDRYKWIGEGYEELKEDIKVMFRPTISIPRDRYEELLKAETTLECLCRFLTVEKPYNARFIFAVAGEKYIPASAAEDGDD